MKLASNVTFDNKEQNATVSGSEQEEMKPEHCNTYKHVNKYLLSTSAINQILIYCIGPWTLSDILNQIVYTKKAPQKYYLVFCMP